MTYATFVRYTVSNFLKTLKFVTCDTTPDRTIQHEAKTQRRNSEPVLLNVYGAPEFIPRMNSASLCSLAGRYDNPIPPRFLAPIDFLKIPALVTGPSRDDAILRFRGRIFLIRKKGRMLYCTVLYCRETIIYIPA